MKIFKKSLTILAIGLSCSFANAQTVSCSDFSILGIGPAAFNAGNSVIHIRLAGDSTAFISYPYISVVADCNGDTIATGSMNFFGQMGQSIQSYEVTGVITNACLPITVEFVYGNTNFVTDTCTLSLSALPTPVTCSDFVAMGIVVDQSNTLINITMQGTANTFISNPRISFVTDCAGDTIATGFVNASGQSGLTTQGYAITAPANTVCYPITIGFIYGNTNFETDTCLLLFDATTGYSASSLPVNLFSLLPNPSINEINISTNLSLIGSNYFVFNGEGKLMLAGKLVSERTTVDISSFSSGVYYVKLDDQLGNSLKFIKQ